MPRPPDPAIRARLLRAAADHVLHHGLTGLSLRPVAAALGTSDRLLIYHFGSRAELIVAILETVHQRYLDLFRGRSFDAFADLWRSVSDPAVRPYMRLFFEVQVLGIAGEEPYTAYVRRNLEDWLRIGERLVAPGDLAPARAAARSTLLVAAVRGLLLDLLATGDDCRVGEAAREVEAWLREVER